MQQLFKTVLGLFFLFVKVLSVSDLILVEEEIKMADLQNIFWKKKRKEKRKKKQIKTSYVIKFQENYCFHVVFFI